MAWGLRGARCAWRTQRAILHVDNTPVAQAESRLRAKRAPEGLGLDAAGVEGSLGAMKDGKRRKRRRKPSPNVNIGTSNRVITLTSAIEEPAVIITSPTHQGSPKSAAPRSPMSLAAVFRATTK